MFTNNNLTDDIIKLYTEDKYSYQKIMQLLHTSQDTIKNILNSHDIKIRHICHSINIDYDTLYKLYINEQLPSTEIAKMYNVTFPTVTRKLREYNIAIRPKYGNPCNKLRVKLSELPSIISNPIIIKEKLTGLVTCPICSKTRRLYLNRIRIKDIVHSNGKCITCAQIYRTKVIDISLLKELYEKQQLTAIQIGKLFSISSRNIRSKIDKYNIKKRKKGLLKIKVVKNKGTLAKPILGDICRGYDIGLNDKAYYIRISCPQCKEERWVHNSHVSRKQLLCRVCAMKLFGEQHRGENAITWLGGKSFEPYGYEFNERLKEQIRKRDNYVCQLCGKLQNGIKLANHHIDYNKKNNHPFNLISLCSSKIGGCHSKTNYNREYWTKYFQELQIKRNILAI